MLLGNIRPDLHSTCRSSRSAPHVSSSPPLVQTPISTPSNVSTNNLRTPISSQQTMMNYARMSYRYTTVRSNLFVDLIFKFYASLFHSRSHCCRYVHNLKSVYFRII